MKLFKKNLIDKKHKKMIFCTLGAVLLAGLVIVYLYNGEKGSSGSGFSRWFFYIFYPAHLLLLGVMRLPMLA